MKKEYRLYFVGRAWATTVIEAETEEEADKIAASYPRHELEPDAGEIMWEYDYAEEE